MLKKRTVPPPLLDLKALLYGALLFLAVVVPPIVPPREKKNPVLNHSRRALGAQTRARLLAKAPAKCRLEGCLQAVAVLLERGTHD